MKQLIYFISFLTFWGCKKDSEMNQESLPPEYCITSTPMSGNLPVGYSCNIEELSMLPDPHYYCDVEHVGTLMLPEVSKCWIPQYQFEIGQTFEYQNSQGEKIELTLSEKNHVLDPEILDQEECDTANYNLGLCYDVETYYIMLSNEDEEIKLYIEMGIDLFRSEDPEYDGKPDVLLRILKIHSTGYTGWGIRAEEYDNSPYILSPFEEKMTLLDKEFNNVYRAGKYWYTKEIGLIGFRDDENVRWVLQD